MIKFVRRALLASALLFCSVSGAFQAASASPAVTITAEGSTTQVTKTFSVPLTIDFQDENLYHEQVYLSYHLYDGEGNEIRFECDRLPIPAPEGTLSHMTVAINLGKYEETAQQQMVKVQFDIVDERNAFWYANTGALSLNADTITFENSLLKRMYLVPLQAIQKHPVIFAVNIAVLIGFVYFIFAARKKLV